MDLYESYGVAVIASRVRRLGELMSGDDEKIYHSYGIDFRSKWLPVFAVLMDGKEHTVKEVAEATGLSHSSVSVMAREMKNAGLVRSGRNANDGRSSVLSLDEKGQTVAPSVRRALFAAERAVSRLMHGCTQNLWLALAEWEQKLGEQSLYDRIMEAREEMERMDRDFDKDNL